MHDLLFFLNSLIFLYIARNIYLQELESGEETFWFQIYFFWGIINAVAGFTV